MGHSSNSTAEKSWTSSSRRSFALSSPRPLPQAVSRHKPSELSSIQTRVLVEAFHQADLPKGLLNVVTGLGNVVGAELVRNPDVAKISFTGWVAVGGTIMRDGAKTMKRVTLELGGKSCTIILDDALWTKRSRRPLSWPL